MSLLKISSDPVSIIFLIVIVSVLVIFPCSIYMGIVRGIPISEVTSTPTNISTDISTPSSTFTPTPTPTYTPTPSLTPTEIPPGVTIPPTFTPTNTPTPTPTFTPTPTSTSVSIPTPTPFPIPTLTPTSSLSPTPTPTPVLSGIVNTRAVNVRWGPSTAYGYVDAVYENEFVTILGPTSDGFWLKIVTPRDKTGWVTTRFITLPIEVARIPAVPTPPPPETLSTTTTSSNLALRGISVSGDIIAGGYQEYTFPGDRDALVFVLMFEPNVNRGKVNKVEFNIYYINRIGEAEFVGSGGHPATDLDGDEGRGELVWRGGPLVSGTQYRLQIINYSSEDLHYCLASQDFHHWSCP